MIVTNPDEANVFLIDHEWLRYTMKDCGESIAHHMARIVHNVVDLYPYYNRSGGRDHFMMAVYDHGAFCDMQCVGENDKSILRRILGASFIGKYVSTNAISLSLSSTRLILPTALHLATVWIWRHSIRTSRLP
jgi:hypothetical protein